MDGENAGSGDEIARTWGTHIAGYSWDHVVTLTTANPLSVERCAREFANRFVRNISRKAQGPIPYFFAIEGDQATGGFPHVHALIAGSADLSVKSIERSWPLGFTKIEIYDPSRAGTWYATKSLKSDFAIYDLSRRMPPRIPR